MKRLQRSLLYAALAATGALSVLCVVGAFLGAQGARALFNSAPMAALWIVCALLLAGGVICAPRFLRWPDLLALHVGPLLILLGSLWSSDAGHRLATRITGVPKISRGYLILWRGEASDIVIDRTGRVLGTLPFAVGLDDFRIERYPAGDEPWALAVQTGGDPGRPSVLVEWREGAEAPVPGADLRLRVLSYEQDAGGGAPAMQVEALSPAGTMTGWLRPEPGAPFARLSLAPLAREGSAPPYLYLLRPFGPAKGYVAEVAILEGSQRQREATIAVNRPGHFAGYQLCYHSHDARSLDSVVLLITSDRGFPVVGAGFALLMAGACWWCWVAPLVGRGAGRS